MSATNDWFSRYRLCQPLGKGGMGVVYFAEDKRNGNRPCVIKQLTNRHTNAAEHAETIRLFLREAQILKGLNHPGIVRVYDTHITSDGLYFLVMDYISGKNLDIMLRTGGRFEAQFAIPLAIQCCEILEYLHGLKPPVIYRDLKPSNLMLTPEGKVILVDFGIARTFLPRQVATRVVSPGYSPPEQYAGRPEVRSDLYALGATLAHLLTNEKPKPLVPSAPASIDPGVPFFLDGLCRQLTAQEVIDRPPSAKAVRTELYKIYAQLCPDVEIPQDLFLAEEPQINAHQATSLLQKFSTISNLHGRCKQLWHAWSG